MVLSLGLGEINKPMLHVSPHQFRSQLVTNMQPLRSLGQQSLNVRLHDANKRPLGSDSGDDGVEGFTHPMTHRNGGQPFRHFPLDFSRGVAFLSAVRGDGGKIVVGVGSRFSVKQRFDQPLRDDVGKAPVGRGRVRVILHGKSEVPLLGIARTLQNIFARSNQLDDRQREVGEVIGIGGLVWWFRR